MKWHKRFIDLATLVSSWSKDPSTKVGAVIVDPKNRIVSVGFNGFAQGINDNCTHRDEKLRRTIHAEENAILFANRSIEGCTIYVTHHPCARCTAKLIQVGIASIIYRDPLSENWEDEVKSSEHMLYEARTSCTPIDLINIHEGS
jgi:dCMP deaminase